MPIAPLDPKELDKQFIKAAQDNQLDELKNLLSRGADIHTADDYALKISATRGHLEVVKVLVTKGADIHADNDVVLRLASIHGHLETVKFLIDRGGDIHANDDEALRNSAYNGHLEIVKFLIAHGAKVGANNDEALRRSALEGQFEVVKLLVTHGANIHVNDDEVFKTATKYENEPILMLLNAFLTEGKLLVAASVSTGASSWFNGMPVLPALGSVALVAASDYTSASSCLRATKPTAVPQTPQLKLKNLYVQKYRV